MSKRNKKEQSWFVSSFDGSSCQSNYDGPASSKRQKIDVSTRTFLGYNIPWVDKYRPTTIGELAVHKKKIEELERLLNTSSLERQKQSPGRVILLTGPAGCGKTASVQAIAADLSVEIAEWINPIEKSVAAFSDFEHYVPGDMIFPEKQATLFRDFISRTSRYSVLGRARNTKSKILLIEDIPNVFYRDSAELHDILSQYIQRSPGFCIFVMSDSVERESSVKKLFPNQVIKDLGIEVVNFNPVATGSMIRVLEKIAVNEGYGDVCRNTLEILAESSGGDVRAAINALQFACLKGCENLDKLFHSQLPVSSRTEKKGTKKKSIKKQSHEVLAPIGGKDANLFLFRVLGKILYGKRNPELEIYGLPPHLHNEERCQLQAVPELLVEKSTAQGSTLALFLHGNFPPFFKKLEDYSNAAESLSYADYIASQWTEDKTFAMDDYYGLIAVRGIIFSNTDVSGGVWRSLKRPYYFTASTQTKKREQLLREEFSATTGLSSFDIVSDMLPFARKLGVKFPPSTDQIVSELTSFNTQNPLEVTHSADTLDEVDLMEIVNDSENVISSDFVEGPAFEATLLQEEEDYVIEEFED